MSGARPDGRALPPDVVARIQSAVEARSGRKEGREWRFLCPAHPDHTPSARWNAQKRVWRCDACGVGGGALDLAKRLDIELPNRDPDGLTVAVLAETKGVDEAFMRSLGVRDGRYFGQPCVLIPYPDRTGEIKAERKRLCLTGSRFKWRKGDKASPYGLMRLAAARSAGYLVILEGESDCWTCWQAGIPAIGVPGAGTWRSEWAAHVNGTERVYVWREPDAGGDSLAAKVIRDLPDVRIIDGPAETKDPNAWLWLGRDTDAFKARMAEFIAAARPASSIRAETLTKEARECLALARPLLEDPALLARIADVIRASGCAGDVTPSLLAYVAITSRLCERPLNFAYIGPSAAGKSYAVDTILPMMPETAYHRVGASSARALIYDDEADYQHRTVIMAEADSMPEDGPPASAIRALAADNLMAYDVVERNETGKFMTRHIRKPGPTGLITTSTRPLGDQLSTRMLTVSVPDTPEQTRNVLLAHAASVSGEQQKPDTSGFVALQRWLELAGDRDVVIPFAVSLAERVPADLVRVRRDFRQLLAVIESLAILYQRQRPRDANGRILATVEDYRRARDLLLDAFTETVTGGVSRVVRETVQAVRELHSGEPIDMQKLGGRLGLHRSTVWRRVQAAVRSGFLVNTETRKGQPAQLAPGAALPEDRPALPDPRELAEVYLPETDATVQQHPPPHVRPVSSGPIATAVARDVAVAQPDDGAQPLLQPPASQVRDTRRGPQTPPVAVLRADPGDEGDVPTRCAFCGGELAGYTPDGSPRCEGHLMGDADGPLVRAAVHEFGLRIARRIPPDPSAPRCPCGAVATYGDAQAGEDWCWSCGPAWTTPRPRLMDERVHRP